MNVHGPKFHRSQQTSRRLVFHKWVRKKNTFTLISIATLMLAIFALRTSAAASPKLVAAPGSLTFGSVGVTSNSTRTVTLTNSGVTVVTISSFNVSGRGFSMSKVATPWKLAAGQSISLEAHFAPVTAGATTGSIAITSNASDPSLVIALSGTGAQGHLSATPASASFGDVALGVNDAKAVRLSNTGTSSLTISHLSLSGKGFSMSTVATPLKLAVGQSISLEVHFAPVTAGAATGSIAITSNASDPSLVIALSGIGAQGHLSATPASASFGDVALGVNDAKAVRLSNTGTSSLTISHLSLSGKGFSMSTVATPLKLAVGQSISLEVHFAPVTAGAATGSIAITSNASDPSLVIALSGIGAQGHLSATPASASFGDVALGVNDAKAVRLSNTGTSSLTISHLSLSGKGFSMSTVATPLKLAVGQSISLEAHFAPVTAGATTGSIAITSNASDPSLVIALSGTGTGAQGHLSATPASASLGKVVVGENYSQTIRLSNTGDGNVTISLVSVVGSDFKIAGLTVPTAVASGKSATFNVLFTPISSGSVTGTVSLISDALNSPLTISLSGTGVAATPLLEASPSGLNFGTVTVDTTSSLSLTLTNPGNADVTISKVAVSGAGFSQSGVAAGTILGPDQSTTLRVAFAPVSAGSVNGDLAVTSNATTSPMMISLSGTAVQTVVHSVALTWDASKSSGVVGYNVYRATVSGGPYTKLTPSVIAETQYTDTTVQAGHIYYYVVTSVDSSGVESSYSNQVAVTIPAS